MKKQNDSLIKQKGMNKDKKTMDLEKLVEHPSSLKLLILHTPFPLEISSLFKCTNLIKLDLSKNNLETFPYIGNLANLKFMFLHQNKLDHKILRGVFFSDNQSSYSPLSRSIVWVTFWGNKNCFLARHFLVNQTNVLAVDDHLVSEQQRKQSVLMEQIQPFSPQTEISYILSKKQSLGKNATEQEYMDQFWQQMRQLRKKIQQICPIIKIQKVFRGWNVRKHITTRHQQVNLNYQMTRSVFNEWKKQVKRKKKLFQVLKSKKKEHFLLPLKQMRLQQIKRKMFDWAERAKKRVLDRKLSLHTEVKFYNTLRSNFLMFKSLYEQLQMDKSTFLMIDSDSFKLAHNTIKQFVCLFNKNNEFKIQENKNFTIRQVYEGHIKKQFARLLAINLSSNVIRINRKLPKKKIIHINLLNENICRIPNHSTVLKPLFKNQCKVYFNKKQIQSMQSCSIQLQKQQNMVLNEFLIIKAQPRVLKDILRCIFYINTNAIKIQSHKSLNKSQKIQVFSEKSLQKLSSITLIQKFWRGYIFRKKQKINAQLCSKKYRAVVRIQRWIRKLPSKKKQAFIKESLPILKSINDSSFYVKMNDYLKFIDNISENQFDQSGGMKILQQNLMPYYCLNTKKIILFWNTDAKGSEEFIENIKKCFSLNKKPLSQYLIQSIFKNIDDEKNKNPFSINNKELNQYEKGEVSHLFHFNTLTQLAQKDSEYWMKITCNSVNEAKLRVLGIMLKSYSFSKGISLKIYNDDPIGFYKYYKKKVLDDESIFITKGDIDLKQKSQQIKNYQFKAKFYLKNENSQKPNKIQENLLIFIHNSNNNKKQANSHCRNQSLESNLKIQIQKPKKRTRLSVEHMYFSQSNLQKNSIVQSKNYTINNDLNTEQPKVKKQDLLPAAMKRILPLKKEIKSYKIQKRLKLREPSFILDNSSKNQRVVTLPDLSIQQLSQTQKNDQNQIQFSTVKQKIKKNYIFRRQVQKLQKQDHSFHQNFVNLNNFLQQQSISQQRRRIKTEIQISAYQSADRIRSFHEKSSDELLKRRQQKMKKVEQDMKNHKETLEKHRLLKEQQKQEHRKIKSIEKQKNKKNRQDVRRLKVSFAEQCFPIINRSMNNMKSSSRQMGKSVQDKYKIS